MKFFLQLIKQLRIRTNIKKFLLKDLNNFSAVNQVYASYFSETPPARETVEISRLPMDAIVEISCIAIKA